MCRLVICTKKGTLYLFMHSMHNVKTTGRGIQCIDCTPLRGRVILCEVWAILQYYKTYTNTAIQFQSGIPVSLLLHRKESISSPLALHIAKKSKSTFKALYHLRWATFILDVQFGEKLKLEHTHKDLDSQ